MAIRGTGGSTDWCEVPIVGKECSRPSDLGAAWLWLGPLAFRSTVCSTR